MTEPEESRNDDEQPSDPILAPPTANPARVQVPPEGPGGQTEQGHPEPSGAPPGEEA